MSVTDAANVLTVQPGQIRKLIASSQLDAARVGRTWLVSSASVASRQGHSVQAGRPLSADSAWRLLSRVDRHLRDDSDNYEEPIDRHVRFRIRQLERALPDVEDWSWWLRRRGIDRLIWFHPGIRARVIADARVRRPDLSSLLGLPASDLSRYYVDAGQLEGLVAEYRGEIVAAPDADGALGFVVVPALAGDVDWRAHVAAAALLDLSLHPDARVAGAACALLGAVAAELGG